MAPSRLWPCFLIACCCHATPSKLIDVWDHALPTKLVDDLEKEVEFFLSQDKRPQTLWLPSAAGPLPKPSSALEEAVRQLRWLVVRAHGRSGEQEKGSAAFAPVGAEVWFQKRKPLEGMPPHFDKDEALHRRSNQVRMPHTSTVTYFNSVGGPTVVFNQTLLADGATLSPPLPSGVAVVQPVRGRHAVFPGQLYHTVRSDMALNWHEGGVKGERLTMLINWWRDSAPVSQSGGPDGSGDVRGMLLTEALQGDVTLPQIASWQPRSKKATGPGDAVSHPAFAVSSSSSAKEGVGAWRLQVLSMYSTMHGFGGGGARSTSSTGQAYNTGSPLFFRMPVATSVPGSRKEKQQKQKQKQQKGGQKAAGRTGAAAAGSSSLSDPQDGSVVIVTWDDDVAVEEERGAEQLEPEAGGAEAAAKAGLGEEGNNTGANSKAPPPQEAVTGRFPGLPLADCRNTAGAAPGGGVGGSTRFAVVLTTRLADMAHASSWFGNTVSSSGSTGGSIGSASKTASVGGLPVFAADALTAMPLMRRFSLSWTDLPAVVVTSGARFAVHRLGFAVAATVGDPPPDSESARSQTAQRSVRPSNYTSVISGLWAAVSGVSLDASGARQPTCDNTDKSDDICTVTADGGFLCSAADHCLAAGSEVLDDPLPHLLPSAGRASKQSKASPPRPASSSSSSSSFLSEAVVAGQPFPPVATSLVQRWRSTVLKKPEDLEHLCVRPSLDRLHLSAFPMHTKCLILVSNVITDTEGANAKQAGSKKKRAEQEEDERLWRALAVGMASVQGSGHVAFETMRASSTSKTIEKLRLPVPKPPLRHHIVALHPISGSLSILPDWGDTSASLTAEGIGDWLRQHEASVVYGQ